MLKSARALLASLGVFLALEGVALSVAAQDEGWVASDRSERIPRGELMRTYSVAATALNLRGDPSVANSPVGTLREGQPVLEVERSLNTVENREWSRVRTSDGGEGWAASAYLEPLSGPLETVERALSMLTTLGQTIASGDAKPKQLPLRPAVGTIRAGFIYPAPVSDAGWTYSHDLGRRAIEKLPFVEKTSYIESIPDDPALIANAIDELVADGANLIFTTSFGFMDPTLEAARRYPQVTFMHCSGFKTSDNVGTYFGRMYEARYLAGMVAGGSTSSGIIGYVAAMPIAEVLRGINAFTLGAQSVNPDVEVRVLWTGTWYGPGIERESADRLIDYGADVLTMHQDSTATVQAAEQRDRYAIGYHSDMSLFAPTASLTAAVWNWEPVYLDIVNSLHDGTWKPEQMWWGLEQGAVALAPLNKNLPDGLQQRVLKTRDDIAAGKLRIFEGTIRDQSGIVRVPSGRVLTDAEMLSMDYLVLGVKGDLPTSEPTSGPDN
ncbi:MAG: BMP family ABC transporter substrate-binding protein [Geminicoccaceae bacterium]|nr:BMP family ABC transporter substrate-binding protein [Geminicoccaceae bacterium]